jgi:hypothetical protein
MRESIVGEIKAEADGVNDRLNSMKVREAQCIFIGRGVQIHCRFPDKLLRIRQNP